MNLKPWREIITPHGDILQGKFQEAEFAADLNKVANRVATPEYQDPGKFFERTFITEGMSLLLKSVVQRMSGQGGDPVIQLKTAFGGGKTHAMLAAYHMVRGELPPKELLGIPRILDEVGVSNLNAASVAILDGHALSPSQPRRHNGCVVNTLWGELAWQLGREEGYSLLSQADQDGISPGKEVLGALFKRFAPCVVLMDETVAYMRQFEEGKSYFGGSFESNTSFMQALTEAASQPIPVVILASLPESEIELGGARGKKALETLEKVFGRVEAVWKPVSTEEGFEIVRRRLFGEVGDTNARDAVCKAFFDMYAQHPDRFPAETRKSTYLERLVDAYPIHPEVFDRLYEDWTTLENFHKTRGVLRLMAMVIHRLWSDGNQDLMIMPGSLPIYDSRVSNELVRYLPQGWEPVIERDIDGPKAGPTHLDEQNSLMGSVQAARRVARTTFLGSAPSVAVQRVRGIGEERIRLGCVQPNQQAGRYDDALKRLCDQLHYLYSGNNRYWYDTRPNLRREMEDRSGRFKEQEDLVPEIEKRLKTLVKGKPFTGVHVFTPHSDIPDSQDVRLVILTPATPHKRKRTDSPAILGANEIQSQRGSQARQYQNRIIYLAPDEDSISNLWRETRRYLAWKSIVDDKERLNLDHHQTKEATQNQDESNNALSAVVRDTFKWILAPAQEAKPGGGVTELFWEECSITSGQNGVVENIAKALKDNELLIPQWSPIFLKEFLQRWFWKEDHPDVPIHKVWDDFCRYPYFPRLVDSGVLQDSISEGMKTTDYFAYATGKDGSRYVGLLFGHPGTVFMDQSGLVVHPDAAAVQKETEAKVHTGTSEGTPEGKPGLGKGDEKRTDEGGTGSGQTKVKGKKRFHATVEINPFSLGLDAQKIAEEIVQHFTVSSGTDVQVTIEIEARCSDGFSDSTQRVVQENCNTLKFKLADFEEE